MTLRNGLLLALAASLTLACAGYVRLDVPDYAEWTRSSYHVRRASCSGTSCRSTLRGENGAAQSRVDERIHARHEIPGWSESRGARIADAVVQSVIRGAGGFTDQVRVSLASSVVTDRADSTLAMRCARVRVFEVRVERRDGKDEEVESRVHATGLRCRVTDTPDTSRTHWTLNYGLVPSIAELAAAYDSLHAAGSPDLAARPPVTLVRVDPDGGSTSYAVSWDPRGVVDVLRVGWRWYVDRADGVRIGVIDYGIQATAHIPPRSDDAERAFLRLMAAQLVAAR